MSVESMSRHELADAELASPEISGHVTAVGGVGATAARHGNDPTVPSRRPGGLSLDPPRVRFAFRSAPPTLLHW